MRNSKRDTGVQLESPFLDEQMVGAGPGPGVTDQLESGDDEGTFTEEEQAEGEGPLEELEADEPAEMEAAWEAGRYGAESEDREPEVSEACEEELEGGDDGAEAEWEDSEDRADTASEFETAHPGDVDEAPALPVFESAGGAARASRIAAKLQEQAGIIATSVALSGLGSGLKYENNFADAVYWQMHPERVRQRIAKTDPSYARLRRDWLDARDLLIRPLYGAIRSGVDLGRNPLPVSQLAPKSVPTAAEIVRICRLSGEEVAGRCQAVRQNTPDDCELQRIRGEAACLERILQRKKGKLRLHAEVSAASPSFGRLLTESVSDHQETTRGGELDDRQTSVPSDRERSVTGAVEEPIERGLATETEGGGDTNQAEWDDEAQTPTAPITVAELMNRLTTLVFWARNPKMKGLKLKPGSKPAAEWNRIRDREIAEALHHGSPEFRIAQLIFFARHPEVRGAFKALPLDEQKRLQQEFDNIRRTDVAPWLSVQIKRGRVNSRTIVVADLGPFNALPRRVRTRAGAEIAQAFGFMNGKEPIRVAFLEPARFPESFNLSDAVVSVTDSHAAVYLNQAIRQQAKNIKRSVTALGAKVTVDDSRRGDVPDRLGLASNGKVVVKVPRLGVVAIPQMASVVDLSEVISYINDEHLGNKQEKIPQDWKRHRWTEAQQDLVGRTLGRAMAHEARHLFLAGHAAAGLGSASANLFADSAPFSRADQIEIAAAIRTFERQQGRATVATSFAAADRAGDFPF
jgi:hypothetical protein